MFPSERNSMSVLITLAASFAVSLLLGKWLIPMLRAMKAGQSIREVGPKWHNTKAGTPTMGGIMFIPPHWCVWWLWAGRPCRRVPMTS